MTVERQLKLWVAGDSRHNPTRNECCPDFSCCRPELRAPRRIRERFAKASEAERGRMLTGFLGRMLRASGHRVETSTDLRGC